MTTSCCAFSAKNGDRSAICTSKNQNCNNNYQKHFNAQKSKYINHNFSNTKYSSTASYGMSCFRSDDIIGKPAAEHNKSHFGGTTTTPSESNLSSTKIQLYLEMERTFANRLPYAGSIVRSNRVRRIAGFSKEQ